MNNLIEKLNEFTGDINDLSKELGIAPSQVGKIWYELLKELKENNISDFENNSGSILEWIKQHSNYTTQDHDDDQGLSSIIYAYVYNQINDYNFWNTSLIDAIKYFRDNIEGTGENDEGWINSFDTLAKANAGNNFDYTTQVFGSPYWTDPEYIDFDESGTGTGYFEARGDALRSVLREFKYLQYTHSQPSDPDTVPPAELGSGKGIRLLMPMYSRHVEVEDLDRNFWVISATLDRIVKDLMLEKTGLSDMFTKLFDETTQLWENIAYLWMTLAAARQNHSTNIHIEVVPISVSDYSVNRKFDNFDLNPIDVRDKIDYLRYKYSEQNLIVLPVIRQNNYQRNWYKKEWYPFVYTYINGEADWKRASLKFENGDYINFSVENYKDIIGAARENQTNYSYCSPYSAIKDYEDDGLRYYGLIRVVPKIKASFQDGQIHFDEFEFNLYDAAKEITSNTEELIATYTGIRGSSSTFWFDEINRRDSIPLIEPVKIQNIHKKYYMGELISDYQKTMAPTFKDANFTIVKIGDFLPFTANGRTISNDPTLFEYVQDTYTPGSGDPYDTATYGVGAFKLKDKTIIPQNISEYHLVFANYCRYDEILNENVFNNENSRETWLWKEGYDITPQILEAMSINRVENLVKLGKLPDEDGLYATKIGISYWTGNDGIQWSSGLVCNLIYYNAEEEKAYNIGFVGMLDGYWTSNTNVFTLYNGNRWRRLSLKADKVIIKTLGDEKSYNIEGGRIVWYDHNKEVYYSNFESESSRPRAAMKLEKDSATDEYKLVFSNPTNTINSNLKMYPYINRTASDYHIFKENKDKLKVYDKYGVQAWVQGSYDENDMDLKTVTNIASYIDTLNNTN